MTGTALRPIDALRSQLTAMAGELRNALPSHIKPEKFQRVVVTVVQQTPELLNADRRSLLAACLKCASDGLVPDGREAALVLFSGRVSYLPMVAGIQKRIRNSGLIASLSAHVIHEHDEFVWRQGTDEQLIHVPRWPGDRGKIIGAYAVARFKDGSAPQFEVLSIDELEKIRSVSRGKNSGPWAQWTSEMYRKTCLRRLSKWLPMDAEVDELLRRDDEIEHEPVNVSAVESEVPAATPALSAPVSKLDVLEGAIVEAEPVTVEAETAA